MKVAIAIIVVFVIALAWFVAKRRVQTSDCKSVTKEHQPPKDIYLGLRSQMLQGSRAKFGLAPTAKPYDAWGVLMDWGITNGTATAVAMSDGSASVYLSSGGGYLGGIVQEPIRKAAQHAVDAAREFQSKMSPAASYPLPDKRHVTFYVLTDSGVVTASTTQQMLSTHQDPLSKLGESMQNVITQYRLWSERQSQSK